MTLCQPAVHPTGRGNGQSWNATRLALPPIRSRRVHATPPPLRFRTPVPDEDPLWNKMEQLERAFLRFDDEMRFFQNVHFDQYYHRFNASNAQLREIQNEVS